MVAAVRVLVAAIAAAQTTAIAYAVVTAGHIANQRLNPKFITTSTNQSLFLICQGCYCYPRKYYYLIIRDEQNYYLYSHQRLSVSL